MAIFSGIAAIGSLVGGSFMAGVGGFILKTAAGIGLNLLAQKIAGKGKDAPSFAVTGKLQAGGDVSRSVLFGLAMTAGSLVYANTWGADGKTPNAYLTQVIAISDLPVKGLHEAWVNGEKVTLAGTPHADRGYPVLEYRVEGRDHLWLKLHDGTQTTADSFLVGTVSSSERPYGSTRVGRGVAYVVATALVDGELFTGFPSFRFVATGARLYDVSKDTTAGGSGSQRWSNPATWGGDGDDLPAVQIYNLLRGVTWGGTWLYGLQALPAARLPSADWVAKVAKCRAAVEGPDGMEPAYRSGGEIFVNAQIADTIEALLTSCQGRLGEAGGFYRLHLGAPDAAIASISDADILSTEAQSFTPFFGLFDTITGISARHPSPEEGWTAKVAPPLLDAVLEARAGNRRLLADVPLDFVPFKGQVQRLMRSALAEAQRARRHTFVLPPEFWGIEPGDTLAWTSARNGYVTKLFRVDGVYDKANADVVVDLTEIDPSDYDWNQSVDYRVPVDGSIGIKRPAAQIATGFQVFDDTIDDNDGNPRRPTFGVQYDGDQPDVSGVEFQAKLEGDADTALICTGTIPYGDPATNPDPKYTKINGVFPPDTTLETRFRYVPKSARPAAWSSWLPVTTPNVMLGEGDIYLPGVVEDVIAFVQEAEAWISPEALREVIDEARRLTASILDQDFGNYRDLQQIRTELASTFQGARAEYRKLITVATGPGSATVQRLEELEATIPELATVTIVDALTATVNAQGDTITAQGGAITAIEVALPGKASVSSVTALSSIVTSQGNTITAQGLAITSLQSALPGKADASAVLLLQTRVTNAEGAISSQSDAILALNAGYADATASANMRAVAIAGPAGYSARIAFQARAGGAGGYRIASLFLDVPASTGQPTRVVVLADQFVVTDGPNNQQPFIFSGGVARMNVAHIGTVTAGLLKSADDKFQIDLTNKFIEIRT